MLSPTLCILPLQRHPEGSERRQGETETDAEEPASLHVGPAARAGGATPVDEEGGPPCCHQRQGQSHRLFLKHFVV